MIGLHGGPQRPGNAQSSRKAAAEHARTTSRSGDGRVRWTTDNVLRLVAVASVGVAFVVGLVYGGWSIGRDEATSRAAVWEYFDAIAGGELTAEVATPSCSRGAAPLSEHLDVDAAGAFDAESFGGSELFVDVGYDLGEERRHDFEVRGLVRGTVVLERTDADEWRVCGLLPRMELLPPD